MATDKMITKNLLAERNCINCYYGFGIYNMAISCGIEDVWKAVPEILTCEKWKKQLEARP
jgi:hypothetical protein